MKTIPCPHCHQLIDTTEMVTDVEAFHRHFGIHYDGPPRFLDDELQAFRITTLHEELQEYEDAVEAKDPAAMFDALIDLIYFALGTIYLHGFPLLKGWLRVHIANMLKIISPNAESSNRGYAKDIVKPLGWVPPDLTDCVWPLEKARNK